MRRKNVYLFRQKSHLHRSGTSIFFMYPVRGYYFLFCFLFKHNKYISKVSPPCIEGGVRSGRQNSRLRFPRITSKLFLSNAEDSISSLVITDREFKEWLAPKMCPSSWISMSSVFSPRK